LPQSTIALPVIAQSLEKKPPTITTVKELRRQRVRETRAVDVVVIQFVGAVNFIAQLVLRFERRAASLRFTGGDVALDSAQRRAAPQILEPRLRSLRFPAGP
jgi:hypothetical protein